jgi:predicted nucleotide-binding protein (sugar kinase/HSP70/actin superfamily)
MFGGRCNKYTNMRKAVKDVPVFDYVEKRQRLLFEVYGVDSGQWTVDSGSGLQSAEAGGRAADSTVSETGTKFKGEINGKTESSSVSGVDSLAKGNGFGGGDLQNQQEITQRRNVLAGKPDETGSGFNTIEHSGGANAEFNEGISALSSDSTRLESGTGNANSTLPTNRLSDRTRNNAAADSPIRNQQNALRLNKNSSGTLADSARSGSNPSTNAYSAVSTDISTKSAVHSPLSTVHSNRNYLVGIPRAFSVHTLYPLYSNFFYELGIKTFLSEEVSHAGVARAESTYCFPAEIAHGAVQDCLDKGADYVLLPHFRDMPSYENDVHANFCPITQSFPYYIDKAFPDVDKQKWLPLVVSFKFGEEKALELFNEMTARLGISAEETRDAFFKALAKQKAYEEACRQLGHEALDEARKAGRPVIAILGRPYNAFTPEANMGIPRKFTTRGYSIVPFDILPFDDQGIFPNMYWYYGQQDIKTAGLLKNEENVYITWITNFSCAPDSFLLHYLKWTMGQKPFLVLELDSHSADAGVDTRVEAFLDIIDGYREKKAEIEAERYSNGWRFEQSDLTLHNDKTGENLQIRGNKRIKILLSNMGAISTELVATALRGININAQALPVATAKTVQVARAHASGKECVPSHLVLGSALQFFASPDYRKDELYMLFVPITTGPCRTGQYFVYYENLFRDLRMENVVVFILSADNSYTELGAGFSQQMWKNLVFADYLKDIQTALKACAADPAAATAAYDKSWRAMLPVIEKNPKAVWGELRRIAADVRKIPLRRSIAQQPRVLVVGEIYVRRDDFAVGELTDLMSERGIVVKVAGIAEWIHYLDFVREYALTKLKKLHKPGARRDLFKLHIEMWWKHNIEKKTLAILKPTGLIPDTPHDMRRIMKYAQDHFVNLELNSEIAVSSGAAAAAMDAGYSGIVNISPFACLIGRVIEGLYSPWARERGYPILSVEVDGNLLPPNIVNKLNIFMVNVLRFRDGGGDATAALIDANGVEAAA